MTFQAELFIEIVEGSNLPPADTDGLSDPYVKICVGTRIASTPVIRKSLDPKWFARFEFPQCISTDMFVFHVMDQDGETSESLGSFNIDITCLRNDILHDIWFRLQDSTSGRIRVKIKSHVGGFPKGYTWSPKPYLNQFGQLNSFYSSHLELTSVPADLPHFRDGGAIPVPISQPLTFDQQRTQFSSYQDSRQPSFYSPGAPYPPSLTGGMAPSHPFSSYIIPSQSVAPSLGTGMYPPIPQPIQQPTYDPMGQAHRASVSSSQAFIYPQPQTFSQP
ncbi:hypothetical protein ADUPG1_007125, partial [Aduncisulcus paluster]